MSMYPGPKEYLSWKSIPCKELNMKCDCSEEFTLPVSLPDYHSSIEEVDLGSELVSKHFDYLFTSKLLMLSPY